MNTASRMESTGEGRINILTDTALFLSIQFKVKLLIYESGLNCKSKPVDKANIKVIMSPAGWCRFLFV